MRCRIDGCTGEYEYREIVHTVRQGNRIIVIDHVPAEVCAVCGDCCSRLRQCAASSFYDRRLCLQCALLLSTISLKHGLLKSTGVSIRDETRQAIELASVQEVR